MLRKPRFATERNRFIPRSSASSCRSFTSSLPRSSGPWCEMQVTIYGVGLIGGSLGLALKRAFPEARIAGVDNADVLERAKRLKIVDATDARKADLVILATPV